MGWENAGIYEAKVNFGGEWKDDCVQAALPTTPPEEHGRNTPSYIRQRWPTSPWNLSKRRCCSKKVRRGPVRTHGSVFLAPLRYRETLSGRRSPHIPESTIGYLRRRDWRAFTAHYIIVIYLLLFLIVPSTHTVRNRISNTAPRSIRISCHNASLRELFPPKSGRLGIQGSSLSLSTKLSQVQGTIRDEPQAATFSVA
jgi:hypothetical protein